MGRLVKFVEIRFYKCSASGFLLLALISITSCSTIKKFDRTDKDYHLNNKNYKQIEGIYTGISNPGNLYHQVYVPSYLSSGADIDSSLVHIKAPSKNKLVLTFVKNDTVLTSLNLRGDYKNGYFSVNTRVGLLSPFFPLLWGPGLAYRSIGITKEKDLVVMKSHGGVAVLIIVPFFASGGESMNEFKRIE